MDEDHHGLTGSNLGDDTNLPERTVARERAAYQLGREGKQTLHSAEFGAGDRLAIWADRSWSTSSAHRGRPHPKGTDTRHHPFAAPGAAAWGSRSSASPPTSTTPTCCAGSTPGSITDAALTLWGR